MWEAASTSNRRRRLVALTAGLVIAATALPSTAVAERRDKVAPKAPTGLTIGGTTTATVSLSWTPSRDKNRAVAGYGLYRDGARVAVTTATSATFSSLSCGMTYELGVDAYDAAGNRSPVTAVSASTSGCPDTSPPSAPSNLGQTAAIGTTIALVWAPSLDNVGVAGYGLYRDGTLIGSTASWNYAFDGLACGTTYLLAVDAYDWAGNRSEKATIVASTSPCPDTEAPSTPTGLSAGKVTATSISLAWSAASDNLGVAGYDVYADGSKVGTTAGTSITVTGLVCGRSYTIAVDAYDAAGNRSPKASLSPSTSACMGSTAPPYRYLYSSGSDPAAAASYGWNLIDVGSKSSADALQPGSQGFLWIGDYNNSSCSWERSDASITSTVQLVGADPKVYGYIFSDEPDPFACPNAPAQHRARHNLIRSLDPVKPTAIVLDSNSGRASLDQLPLWVGTSDIHGIDPYPCHVAQPCDFAEMDRQIAGARAAGLNYWIVAQTFQDSSWRWPTVSELTTILSKIQAEHRGGYMAFAWTWSGNSLTSQPDLLSLLKQFNEGSPAGGGDTTPPTAPGGLSGSGATETSVSLSWTAATDNVGVAGYGVYRDATLVATSTQTSYTLGGLSCGRSYTLAVDAFDAAGNRSSRASQVVQTAVCALAPPSSSDPVVAAAGDIAGSATDSAGTALVLDQIAPDRVLTLGDHAYPDGAAAQFASFYDPNWGRHKAITKPAPGNHEYHTSGAGAYFDYFGAAAGERGKGYYSFDLGSWHLIAINSEISVSAGSAQEQWLNNDIATTTKPCVLAYWHRPRFSSGEHGSSTSVGPLWNALYTARADVVLNGHDHDYERFALQNPSGQADSNGIREFVVGTGGVSHYTFGTPVANSQARNGTSFGVLKLTLHASSYDWQFMPEAGATFTDSGSASCH